MENLFSIGTYSISTDGVSLNYTAPSILPANVIETIMNEGKDLVKKEDKDNSFNKTLSAVLKVPKEG